ncbi:MAG: T9SS type A sorting domain-containing protein [Chitinophagales bacterium]|nr:T9SS type A sorting domain-containing protein [Chitinophagales bacterium]
MKYISATFILLLLSSLVIGQKWKKEPPRAPFERLEFKDFEPKWMVDVFDSALVRLDTFNGHNSIRNLRIISGVSKNDNKIYRCNNIEEYDYIGFIVTCIDDHTGDVVWSKIIDTSHYSRQMSPIYQNFDNNGNLVIIGFRKIVPYSSKDMAWVGNNLCKLFKLVLDGQDGRILSYHSPESNQNIIFNPFQGNTFLDFFNYKPNGEIDFLYNKPNPSPLANIYVISGRIDSLGSMVFLDSLEYHPKGTSIYRTNYAQKDDHFFFMEEDLKQRTIHFIEMDANLKEIKRFQPPNFIFNLQLPYLLRYTDDYMLFIQINDNSNKEGYYLYIYDYNGRLLKFYDVENQFISQYLSNSFIFDYDDISGKLLIYSCISDKDYDTKTTQWYMDITLYDGETYDLCKRIEVKNKNRTIWPEFYPRYHDEENIYLSTHVGLSYYRDDGQSFPGFATSQADFSVSILKMSRASLGLGTTKTTDLATQNCLKLYPNPTTGLVSIENLEALAKVDIYDLNGSLVQTNDNVTSEVNIENLKSGIYILNIKNNQINERHKIIKIE